MQFDTTVADIPCKCVVHSYSPPKPMLVIGDGFGDALPPEEEDFHFSIHDRKGYSAPWLERKLDDTDYSRLITEYKELMGSDSF